VLLLKIASRHPSLCFVCSVASSSQAFKEEMTKALRDENDPLDANLEKVIPGLHQWHSVNHSAVTKLTQSVDNLSSNVSHGLQDIFDVLKKERELADQRLAEAFRRLANAYEREMPCDMEVEAIYETAINEMPPVPTVSPEISPAECPNEEEAPYRKAMIPKHQSLLGLWNEWHGLDDFADEFGGVLGREKQFGSKWRNKGKVNHQHFSRTKRIIQAIDYKCERDKMRPLEVIEEWEKQFSERSNCSVSNFVKTLKDLGYITERAPRYKKAKQQAND
jgi:Transcriptional activator of glycolytic enzymes